MSTIGFSALICFRSSGNNSTSRSSGRYSFNSSRASAEVQPSLGAFRCPMISRSTVVSSLNNLLTGYVPAPPHDLRHQWLPLGF